MIGVGVCMFGLGGNKTIWCRRICIRTDIS